jgi:hypothetical protein
MKNREIGTSEKSARMMMNASNRGLVFEKETRIWVAGCKYSLSAISAEVKRVSLAASAVDHRE